MSKKYRRTSKHSSRREFYSSWNTHLQSHWGQKTWDAIFLLAADFPHDQACTDDQRYPPEWVAYRRRSWKKLFQSLPGVLSCPKCGEHFRKYMERDNGRAFHDALENRETLFAWLHKCKDEVNNRTKRKSSSLHTVKKKYIAKCSPGKELR